MWSNGENPLASASAQAWDEVIEAVEPASLLVVIESRMSAALRRVLSCEDILQESLPHAWRDRERFEWRGLRSFRTWLLNIIENRIRDAADRLSAQKRGEGREPVVFSALQGRTPADGTTQGPVGPISSTTPSRIAVFREQAAAMQAALTRLPDELREVVRLRLYEQLSLEEIAERLGIGVKPSNILLRCDGTPMLADFGLARESDSTVHTQAGQFTGTAPYAPPEQLRGEMAALDARSDVYALGVTLYHALALRLPYEAGERVAMLRRIEAGLAAPLRKVNHGIPRDLETIVAKAMDAEPARRYQTADELADDLERLLALQPIRAQPATRLRRLVKFARRNPVAFTASVISAVALFFGAWFGILQARRAVRAEHQAAELAELAISPLSRMSLWTTGNTPELEAFLDRYRRSLDASDALSPALESKLGFAVAEAYVSFGQTAPVVPNLRLAEPQYRRALELGRAAHGRNSMETVALMLGLADLLA